ncbi:MAG: exosortase-associated EpsI family protein [Pedosphaera sp.]|nr:exosortase-associated EpsI family protein [Pedosphaera sp.]
MTRSELKIFGLACLVMALCALVLLRLQRAQKLGVPGVRVVQEAIRNEAGRVVANQSVYLPSNVEGYTFGKQPVTDMELNWLPKDTTYGRAHYTAKDGFETRASVVLMGADRTSIHKPQYCLVGQGWQIEKTEVVTVRIPKPHPYDMKVMKLTTSIQRRVNGQPQTIHGLYTYWFVADQQMTPDHLERMMLMARDMLTSNTLQRWAYITYFSVCYPGSEGSTFERMKEVMALTVPEFQLSSGPQLGGQQGFINESSESTAARLGVSLPE